MSLILPPDTTSSFEKSAIPLLLALKPSRIYLATICAVHVLAVVAIFIAAIPVWIKICLSILVAVSGFFNIAQHNKPQQIVWRTGDRWFINESSDVASLRSIDFFSRWLVILTLAREKQRAQKFIIVYDCLPKDVFRLLRVRLKIEGFALLNPEDDEQ